MASVEQLKIKNLQICSTKIDQQQFLLVQFLFQVFVQCFQEFLGCKVVFLL